MNIKKVNLVYFSPTGNTRKTVKAIASGIGIETIEYDLTRKESREQSLFFESDELVIVGSPVYAGRIPNIEGDLFRALKGENTPVVLVVNYGNREYEDSLLELKNILKEKGFVPLAAGAFIGEHSYSRRIATNRPDTVDLEKAIEFGKCIRNKIEGKDFLKGDIKVSGNYPYKEGIGFMPFAPMANDKCTSCGKCIGVCPTNAISKKNPKETDIEKCIKCFACIRSCPVSAKSIEVPAFKEKIEFIEGICLARRKEIETII
ncbi:EFR1 family ferrodoxin [Clostridium cylindrosporum]|uniref:Ferredoxin n=1 Tax=Clostridium cylindrosporum DSM 605 TaxID=1121307 RepID=A0A0J8DBV8_CLOCY|nr:EFR1 family ferrodoxin [Clostridium cylindrosporum]KMT23352.1 4Fe-4S ferredoxin [Clostridium cylindrosporum DSM 605]